MPTVMLYCGNTTESNMKYYAITNHIIDTSLSQQFVDDIEYCEKKRIPLALREARYHGDGEVQVFRADGKDFQSGKDYWIHNIDTYPIFGKEHIDNHFTEELFTI